MDVPRIDSGINTGIKISGIKVIDSDENIQNQIDSGINVGIKIPGIGIFDSGTAIRSQSFDSVDVHWLTDLSHFVIW